MGFKTHWEELEKRGLEEFGAESKLHLPSQRHSMSVERQDQPPTPVS